MAGSRKNASSSSSGTRSRGSRSSAASGSSAATTPAAPSTPTPPNAEELVNQPKRGATETGVRTSGKSGTVDPNYRQRSVSSEKQYGESSREEHLASGYRLPEEFYMEPIPAEERVEGGPLFRGAKSRKGATPENKSSTKTEENK